MRPSYFLPLAFGILLIYMGVFGLNGFGLNASLSLNQLSLPAKDEFQNLNAWTPQCTGSATATVQSVGPSDGSSLFLDSSNGGIAEEDCRTIATTSVTSWTCFVSAKIDVFGSGFEIKYLTGNNLIGATVSSGTITFSDGSSSAATIDNNWHLYILQVTASGTSASVKFLLDSSVIRSFNAPVYSGVSPTFELRAISGAKVYVDFVALDSGLQTTLAGTAPSTTTGILVATGRRNGANQAGVVVKIGGLTGTTGSDGTVTISNVPSGPQTAVASLSGYSDVTALVAITAGTTPTTYLFNFADSGAIVKITVVQSPHGTITPKGDALSQVLLGYAGQSNSQIFTITSDSGYHIASITLTDPSAAVGALPTQLSFTAGATTFQVTLDDNNIQTSRALGATFESGSASTTGYSIVVVAGSGGSIAPAGTNGIVSVTAGQAQTMTVNVNDPATTIITVTVDGSPASQPYTAPYTYTFPASTTGSHSFSATFSTGSQTANFAITVNAGSGGKITPSGPQVTVSSGGNQPFIIAADSGYQIQSITVDGSPYSFTSGSTQVTYTGFTNIVANHNIAATFSTSSNSNTNPSTIPSVNFNIDWSGIWKNMNSLVDANREPLLAVGGLISLFSFIGLMLPTKKIPFSFG